MNLDDALMFFSDKRRCISIMRTISYSQLLKNLASTLDKVAEESVIITQGRGKPPVVLMSLEEFTSWEETLHLLRSPANAARLMEAVRSFEHPLTK